ncbi:hypothetical protein ABBQ38_012437 [Trebouxia sp. C0009 RCD-2024]
MTDKEVTSSPAPSVKTPAKEANSSAPIFGSASTFGTGSGFAGFTGVDTTKSKAVASTSAVHEEEEETANDEECAAEYTPVVELQEVETSTGEETETPLFDVKCKLYRFDNEAGEWKERGTGKVKLLEDKETQRVRLLMREEKTLKIRANHIGAQEFKKLFEESMQINAKFISNAEADETDDDSHTNGATAEEDKTQDKATSDLADSVKSKVKVEDA